eukprot:Gb_28202 [translate_table: standard]
MDSYEILLWVATFLISAILSGVLFVAGERHRRRDWRQSIRLWLEVKEMQWRSAILKLEEYSDWCVDIRNNERHLHFPLRLLKAQIPPEDVRRIKEAEVNREIAASYWDAVEEMYRHGELERDFFSSKTHNLSKWEKYRNVAEAIDIAYFYGMALDEQSGDYYDDGNRPGRYRLIEEIWLNSVYAGEKDSSGQWWKELRKSICEEVKGLRRRLRGRPEELHIEIGEPSN